LSSFLNTLHHEQNKINHIGFASEAPMVERQGQQQRLQHLVEMEKPLIWHQEILSKLAVRVLLCGVPPFGLYVDHLAPFEYDFCSEIDPNKDIAKCVKTIPPIKTYHLGRTILVIFNVKI
jgi:hypothetical protein